MPKQFWKSEHLNNCMILLGSDVQVPVKYIQYRYTVFTRKVGVTGKERKAGAKEAKRMPAPNNVSTRASLYIERRKKGKKEKKRAHDFDQNIKQRKQTSTSYD